MDEHETERIRLMAYNRIWRTEYGRRRLFGVDFDVGHTSDSKVETEHTIRTAIVYTRFLGLDFNVGEEA
jgi:hypothetical protein